MFKVRSSLLVLLNHRTIWTTSGNRQASRK